MPIDRDATLKQAEKLLRLGRLDGAIAEYVRLVEDQPRDWTSINALGDLYVRAGNVENAVAQFTRVADFLFAEGFLPKAVALYKKALKVKPDHEHTLLRLSELAGRQGLLADARQYLRQLGRQRSDRGDTRGAAACLVRLAQLEEADADTKLAGARAAQELGDAPLAVGLFKEAAEELAKANRPAESLEALAQAATLDPGDAELRRHLARESVAAGQLDRARAFLTRDSAGADPDLLLTLGRMELASGNEAEARAVFTRLITVAPERAEAVSSLAEDLAERGQLDQAFICADIVADDALLASDWNRALEALRAVLKHGAHIPALMKVIELAVDLGDAQAMHEAQEQLADAYLAAGRGAEARVIAEDLVSREPSSDAHVERLRRALALLDVPDPESVIARFREPADAAGEPLDLNLAEIDSGVEEGVADAPQVVEPSPPVEQPRIESAPPAAAAPTASHADDEDDDAIVLSTLEVDLSDALAGLGPSAPAPSAPEAPRLDQPPAPAPPLEAVFEQMRASQERQVSGAAEQYQRGLQHLDTGRIAEGIAELQSAARAPVFRFEASARLGRIHIERGDLQAGVDWLERAAEAPAPSPEEGWAVLYDLAGALERMGETARALAILMEIEADGGSYRDLRERIELLTRAQAGGRR